MNSDTCHLSTEADLTTYPASARRLSTLPLDAFGGDFSEPLIQRRSALLISAATVLASAGLHGLPSDTEYTGMFQLATHSTLGSAHSNSTDQSGDRQRIARQIQALQRPELIRPAIDPLRDHYPDLTYETLTRDLEISYNSGADALNVTYRNADAEQVEAVLQAVAGAYLTAGQTCQTPACVGTEFIETQLSQMQTHIGQLQNDLSTFDAHHRLSDLNTQLDQLSGRVNRLTQQRINTDAELLGYDDLKVLLEKQFQVTGTPLLITELLAQIPSYNERLHQIQVLNRYLANELSREAPDRARLQTIQSHRQKLIHEVRIDIHLAMHNSSPTSALGKFRQTLDSDRLNQLEMWVQTSHELHIQHDYRHAIAQIEHPLTQHLARRQALVNYRAHLQHELQVATQTVNQYQARLAELQPIAAQQQQSWQLIAAPEIIDGGADHVTVARAWSHPITSELSKR